MNLKIVAAAGTVLGLAVGAATGYFLAKKQLEEKFDQRMTREVAEVKAYLGTMAKKDLLESKGLDVRTPAEPEGVVDTTYPLVDEDVLNRVKEGLIRYKPPGVTVAPAPSAAETLVKNIFEEQETKKPKKAAKVQKPYVITEQQFMDGDEGFAQVQLTYYNGDDTLADESDVPLDNVDRIVGRENLDDFDENNTLYVRNERLNIDYEVTRSTGSYSVEVLGQI